MLKLRLLVVDDDPDILDLLQVTLDGEFEVITAACGNEALAKIKKTSPDLLVLDYNLPDFQGPQICEILRKDPIFLHIPILMLTGKGEVEDKVRGLEAGADDYMVKPFLPQELIARIRMLIKRSNIKLDANPLTRLPGNVSINKELDDRIHNNSTYAVLYIDIDNFKALNDYYGFEKGDDVIKETARILISSAQQNGTVNDFIGHIGGDDFVIVTIPEKAEQIAKKIISSFDIVSPKFFEEEDRKKGYLQTKGRDGQIHKYGFSSISIGILTSKDENFTHTAQISSCGAEVKTLAKKFEGSKYIFNRRTPRAGS
ncbi:MAG: response regulator [Candidatus Omnitrophica bacterium]|nr:response regulator [Candidatus Omnitrophota bacterium]